MSDKEKIVVKDTVNHPEHYTAGKVECIDALEAATSGLTGIEAVCTANAIKYLWRWKLKNGAEDLNKAKWYIDRLIQRQGKEKQEIEAHKPETCRERMKRENPALVGDCFVGGCSGCPHHYGYAKQNYLMCAWGSAMGSEACGKCWDRPVEEDSKEDCEDD